MWLDEINNLELPKLTTGSHDKDSKELCLMELIAFMEREKHSDRPECVCRTMTHLGILLNDFAPNDDYRQRLLRLAPMLVGTATYDDRPAPTMGQFSPEQDLYVIRRMEHGMLSEKWGHQREFYVTVAEIRAEKIERFAQYISGDPRGRGHDYLRQQRRDEFNWHNPYERANRAVDMIGSFFKSHHPDTALEVWLMAYSVLEAAIIAGPHTPEQKGWVAPRELKRAKQWVKEYAVVA